ncbi:MAG: spore coat protein [Clostridia bacterium]|nr:spore coat protein [Clostridia bacterium]
MKQSKKDISLNEKDALQDMLNAEKQLMNLYTVALMEGSSKSLRKEFLHNCSATAEDQFSVFEQMLARGYYETTPAEPPMIKEKTEQFSKVLKQIS